MKNIFFAVLFVFALFACEDDKKATELTFVKTISLDSLEAENFQNVRISDNGTIFLNTHSPSFNSISHIYKYSFDGQYKGRFVDTTTKSKIAFYNFYLNIDNNINLFSLENYSSPQIRSYKTDGTFLNSKSLSSLKYEDISNLFYGHWPFAFDSEGNLYTVSSNTSGVYNEIVKIKSDYSTMLMHLKVEDIKKLFPNQNGQEIRITDVAIDKNNKVYITVDRIAEDEDKDKDGILVLDSNLQLVKFIGSNWEFNGPSSIYYYNAHFYVINMYSKAIKVFDENFGLVAEFNNKSDNYVLESPEKIVVKGEYIYVVDYKNGKKILNVFENLK
jgi:hypothetical protein